MPVDTSFANVRGIGSSELMHELPLPRILFARQIPASLRQKFQLHQQPLLSLEFKAAVA